MIEFSELSLIAQKHQFHLQTYELITLHNSLLTETYSIYPVNKNKVDFIKNFYSKLWLKTEIYKVKKDIENLNYRKKIKLIGIDHKDYPKSLLKLPNPPPHFFLAGRLTESRNSMAIVGRREAKPYTIKWMEENISPILSKYKPTVISGGARGVDTKAHQLALLNQSPTIYVIPSGLNCLYPSSLEKDFDSLLKSGAAFISTYLPEAPMRKQNFANRNWIIAALTNKILILEAEIRSGTYKTAQYAQELNLDIAAIPSFPTDLSYSGSLKLIQEGACMIRDYQDLDVFLNFNKNESFL